MDDRDFVIKNELIEGILERLSPYLHGKRDALLGVLACAFSGGHMLLEDLPGLGKTTLAIAVSRVLGLSFGRIQCTNDLLPTDVTGLNVFKADKGTFEFHPGPIFHNLVLVDEINRATPKTQSALLEAMGEEQTTIDGTTYKLARPFLVIATQNPVEHSGTFPLPESQMDRFMMKLSIGYPDHESEMDILRAGTQRYAIEEIEPLLSPDAVVNTQTVIGRDVKVSEKILAYILALAERSRSHPLIETGISTRGAMVLTDCARTVAWMRGRDYVIPEDVKLFAREILAHRLLLKGGSSGKSADLVATLLEEISALPVK